VGNWAGYWRYEGQWKRPGIFLHRGSTRYRFALSQNSNNKIIANSNATSTLESSKRPDHCILQKVFLLILLIVLLLLLVRIKEKLVILCHTDTKVGLSPPLSYSSVGLMG
jgi:hypothetical protein